ncbi:PREDICTED: uncharacterized protein LOC109194108 [Ipomoea nil]|uniref:uncharacterized protein LOC109194108 n=1 Tax=Ipomoea nil TaxID=35883 RepID=UPI000900CF8E|nr:PREDICTED: uncharacterized protein LOC109194108 [Ipomoea nil]
MVFDSYALLKSMVTHHNLRTHIHFTTLCKRANYWKAGCLYPQQCKWMISAGQISNTEKWKVKKYHAEHTCGVDYTKGGADYNLTSRVIADYILSKIEGDPQYKIKYIINDVHGHWGVRVGYNKAWYVKVLALENLYGKWDESYNIMPKLLLAIQQTNPGSVVDFELVATPTTHEFAFKYAFWALKPALDGFKYCLPILTIDGTHLYGKYGGYLLLAVGYNANKEIYPVAYSVVDAETGDSWTWFLKLFVTHVFGDREHICIISDRHLGIDAAFRTVDELREPRVQRQYCLRHLRSNVMTKFKNKELNSLVWQAGCAPDERGFNSTMRTIRTVDEAAYNYLNEIPPRF